MKKNRLLIGIIIIILILGTLGYLQYTKKINLFSLFFKPPVKTKPINIFGKPKATHTFDFPSEKPQFTAAIGKAKEPSSKQQTITIYKKGDTKKVPLFDRGFYTDEFRGNELTYTLASDSATITQQGILGSLGCLETECLLPWTNFYTWDDKQHNFILDNTSHKDTFQDLLANYQAIDEKGCSIMTGEIISNQKDLSFTDLYTKLPNAASYCSKTQGILRTNLGFFMQTEKTLNAIVKGENLSSIDIRAIEL